MNVIITDFGGKEFDGLKWRSNKSSLWINSLLTPEEREETKQEYYDVMKKVPEGVTDAMNYNGKCSYFIDLD